MRDMITYTYIHLKGRDMYVNAAYRDDGEKPPYYTLSIGNEFGSCAHIFIDEKQIYQLVKELVDKTGIEISPGKELTNVGY